MKNTNIKGGIGAVGEREKLNSQNAQDNGKMLLHFPKKSLLKRQQENKNWKKKDRESLTLLDQYYRLHQLRPGLAAQKGVSIGKRGTS